MQHIPEAVPKDWQYLRDHYKWLVAMRKRFVGFTPREFRWAEASIRFDWAQSERALFKAQEEIRQKAANRHEDQVRDLKQTHARRLEEEKAEVHRALQQLVKPYPLGVDHLPYTKQGFIDVHARISVDRWMFQDMEMNSRAYICNELAHLLAREIQQSKLIPEQEFRPDRSPTPEWEIKA
jgi:hypothetical protein